MDNCKHKNNFAVNQICNHIGIAPNILVKVNFHIMILTMKMSELICKDIFVKKVLWPHNNDKAEY